MKRLTQDLIERDSLNILNVDLAKISAPTVA